MSFYNIRERFLSNLLSNRILLYVGGLFLRHSYKNSMSASFNFAFKNRFQNYQTFFWHSFCHLCKTYFPVWGVQLIRRCYFYNLPAMCI